MDAQMLQTSLAQLTASFNARMAHFEAELKTPGTSTTTAELTAEFGYFKIFVKETLNTLQRQIEVLAGEVDSLEMRTRRKMILLHGVKEQPKEKLADVVAAVIKEHLDLPDFTVNDIRRCHRMGRSTDESKSRTIAVKLDSLPVRDRIWFSKTKFKGTGITVSEFLTKQRHEIFLAARERFGIKQCWTREGIIYITASGGSRHRITSLSELDRFPGAGDPQKGEKAAKSKRSARKK